MYFPYLRCKQFDLLALRELIGPISQAGTISPILEPVKASTSPLEKVLDGLIAGDVNFTLIINPLHGDFIRKGEELVNFVNRKLAAYNNFQFGVLIHASTNLPLLTQRLAQFAFDRPLCFIHTSRPPDLDELTEWAADKDIRFHCYPEQLQIRRYRGLVPDNTRVLLEDKFILQEKNALYTPAPEFFSDEHLFYEEDGLAGFGDYLTIGDDYSETGFLPYAVAIHLTYIRADKRNEIWIRHFVSDSNRDNTDVAGKFAEALAKLIEFIDELDIQTDAANEFRQLAQSKHYPGLGTLKKLSIKNHLELLISLLD